MNCKCGKMLRPGYIVCWECETPRPTEAALPRREVFDSMRWVVDAKAEIKRRKKLAKMHDSKGNYRGADYHFAYIAGIRFAIKAERKRSTTSELSHRMRL
jgi:hypothetical protein